MKMMSTGDVSIIRSKQNREVNAVNIDHEHSARYVTGIFGALANTTAVCCTFRNVNWLLTHSTDHLSGAQQMKEVSPFP
jgi:hypothetical protein